MSASLFLSIWTFSPDPAELIAVAVIWLDPASLTLTRVPIATPTG